MALKVKTKNGSRAMTRLLGIFIALGVIVFVIVMTAMSESKLNQTITVVRIKGDQGGISADSLITEDMVEPYDMYYKEYEAKGTATFSDGSVRSVIVTWADREHVLGKRFAAYYLHAGSELYWDMTLSDQTRKNSYLYSMDGELLNIHMTTTQDFGDMVVPGDKLNIRVSYTQTVYNLPSEEMYKLGAEKDVEYAGVEQDVIELLFSEVTILDMLNSAGNSIFDIYYDFMAAPKAQQATMLQDQAFLQSVQPASILLEVTAEEAERYVLLQSKGCSFQMTLLPRTSSSTIYDGLADIQKALAGIAGQS